MIYEGKTALVTGASRGIGRAVARALTGEGARVIVHCHRDKKSAEATRASLRGAGALDVDVNGASYLRN